MQIHINRYNFQGISNLTMLADLHGLLAPKEALNLKNHVSKISSLNLDSTKPYNLLVSGNLSIFFDFFLSERAEKSPKVNINSWTKFPFDHSQPSKAVKFNRQPSNWTN